MNFKNIERLVWLVDGKIFGGYVRDSLIGETPADMDILLSPREYLYQQYNLSSKDYYKSLKDDVNSRKDLFISKLTNAEKIDTKRRVFKYEGSCTCEKYKVGENYIDIITGNPFVHADFDVNMLVLSDYGNKLEVRLGELLVMDVISNIMKKQYRPIDPSFEREQHMKTKGWRVM